MIEANIDYAQPIGLFQKYHRYVTQTSLMKGPLDRARIKDIGIDKIVAYYAPRDLVTSEYVEFSYNFNNRAGNYYGDDSVLDDMVLAGASPIIVLYPSMPKWVGGGYYALPYYNESSASPNPGWSWIKHDQMLYDILTHIKDKYPMVTELGLFEEANGSFIYNPDSDDPPNHRYQWRVWGKTYAAGGLEGGEIYKEFYTHTSDTIIKFNTETNYNFTLSPTSIGIGNLRGLRAHEQLLYYLKNKIENNIPILLSGISFDHYDYSPGTIDTEYVDERSLISYQPCTTELKKLMNAYNIPNIPINVTQYAPYYNIELLDPYIAATSCAKIVALWKNWMDLQPLEIRPWYWALNDYGSISSALLSPRHSVSKDLVKRAANDLVLSKYKDGTIFPMYNVFKMMSWQKDILFYSDNPNEIISSVRSGVYQIATGDDNGIVAMVARVRTTEDIIVHINNLPQSFLEGDIHVELYFIDGRNSNALTGYNAANQELKKVLDVTIPPTLNYTVNIPSISDYVAKDSVTLIKMTPMSVDDCPTPYHNYTITQI